jgi:TPR repeat protein
MRREDIELRTAARSGNPQASLSMAEKLLTGADGFPCNPKLGLAYLQQELARASPAALLLVARAAPLELIVAHKLRAALVFASQADCHVAKLKLGVWAAMSRAERQEAPALLRQSGLFAGAVDTRDIDDPRELAALLRDLPPTLLDVAKAAIRCAHEALSTHDVASACYSIRVAAGFAAPGALAAVACQAVYLGATVSHQLDLPTEMVEAALDSGSRSGDQEAQYALGCGLAGLDYGKLKPAGIARERNLSKAAGLLLRAAEAGKPQAWLNLFEIIPGSRSAIANHDVARFFLEKAARSGLVEAQTRLGQLLLAEASCLRGAEEALQWLATASEAGDETALGILRTLVLPIAELPADYEQNILEKIAARDRDLGLRMALARALHLTRHEALSFNPSRDLRAWGLVLPGSSKENPKGRVAPAVSAGMKHELQRAEAFYRDSPALDATFVLRRARAQKAIFGLLSISQELFFAPDIGRSCSHYGYGKHWHARATGQKNAVVRPPFDALSAPVSSTSNAVAHLKPVRSC